MQLEEMTGRRPIRETTTSAGLFQFVTLSQKCMLKHNYNFIMCSLDSVINAI